MDREISNLFSHWLDGDITPEQAERLVQAMTLHPEIAQDLQKHLYLWDLLDQTYAHERARFVNACLARQAISQQNDMFIDEVKDILQTIDEISDDSVASDFDPFVDYVPAQESQLSPEQVKQIADKKLNDFLNQQSQQDVVEHPKPSLKMLLVELGYQFNERLVSLYRMFRIFGKLALAGLAILLLVLIGRGVLDSRIVGTLGDSKDAVWRSARTPGMTLLRETLVLEQGLAQVHLKQGTTLLLQAPATLTLESANQVFMQAGSLTAQVPTEAVGFTVTTPSAKLIDLGTEFGIMAGLGKTTEAHVFQGEVLLNPGVVPAASMSLKAGVAAFVDANGIFQKTNLNERSQLFVRQIPEEDRLGVAGKQLNLADIIGGGNGLGTGNLGGGIDPSTGAWLEETGNSVRTINGFRPVRHLPAVDGVFIPDASIGDLIISSTGLTFGSCPDTTGRCRGGILNGAEFGFGQGRLNGIDYQDAANSSIGLGANMGITLDLKHLRDTLPSLDIARFFTLCGLTETKAITELHPWRQWVNVYVLVDGDIRFSQSFALDDSHFESVEVELEPSDRFLTLVATMTGEAQVGRVIFAEPVLALKTKQSEM